MRTACASEGGWWFWTGAGVLVAGAASVDRAPTEGSLGTFQAPLTKR